MSAIFSMIERLPLINGGCFALLSLLMIYAASLPSRPFVFFAQTLFYLIYEPRWCRLRAFSDFNTRAACFITVLGAVFLLASFVHAEPTLSQKLESTRSAAQQELLCSSLAKTLN